MRRIGHGDSLVDVLVLVLLGSVLGIAAPESTALRLLEVAILGLALLVAMRASGIVGRRHNLLRLVVGVAVVTAVVGILLDAGDLTNASTGVIHAFLAALGPYIVWLGVRRKTITVNAETVAGALAIYLLLGATFAAVYGVIDSIGSTPMFGPDVEATSSTRLYFSFITMATVGYGDITPVGGAARAAAVLQAVTGQLYLVTVVAIVVSNLGRPRVLAERRNEGEREEPAAPPAGGGAPPSR